MIGLLRILLAAGIVAGVLAGAIVALAVPAAKGPAGATSSATPRATPPPARPLRSAAQRPQPRGGSSVGLRADPQSVRIEARTPDPRGGPDWALRTFRAARVVPEGIRRPGVDPVIGRNLCAQLGRIDRGRFGWIDASATFRPVGFGLRGAPTQCGSRRPDMGRKPLLGFELLMTDPARNVTGVHRSVLWGIAGPAARSASIRLAGRRVQRPLSPRGGLLVLAAGALRAQDVSGELRYGSGPAKRFDLGAPGLPPIPGAPPRRGHPVGPSIVAARAPDPNGGLPWGVLAARASAGGWCVTRAARIVGDRIGTPDLALGTLRETQPGLYDCPGNRGPLTRKRPFSVSGEYGGGPARAGPQRIARRTLPGRTVLSGVARDDVARVTIATPRDVRTLIPSSGAHAFVVVYDGTFPTGEGTLTATFEDGTTAVERLPFLGMP